MPSGRTAFQDQRKILSQKGESFHIDHSYRFVKCVRVTDASAWVTEFLYSLRI